MFVLKYFAAFLPSYWRYIPANSTVDSPTFVLGCNGCIRVSLTKIKIMATIQKLTANLWFDNQAEEAANYYISIFKNSRIQRITRYGKEGFEIHGRPAGSVMTVEFEIEGQQFVGLNGGPHFKFTEAISFIINCDSGEEVDYYWEKLSKGGDEKAQQCGWLKDKFGLSWQVVPTEMNDMFADENSEKSQRVMRAMLQMKKLDIKLLRKAYNGD
jgi:predicted 3-demethylubiquinone-9 3-methyltransferase (glyoxalase superfamily)